MATRRAYISPKGPSICRLLGVNDRNARWSGGSVRFDGLLAGSIRVRVWSGLSEPYWRWSRDERFKVLGSRYELSDPGEEVYETGKTNRDPNQREDYCHKGYAVAKDISGDRQVVECEMEYNRRGQSVSEEHVPECYTRDCSWEHLPRPPSFEVCESEEHGRCDKEACLGNPKFESSSQDVRLLLGLQSLAHIIIQQKWNPNQEHSAHDFFPHRCVGKEEEKLP